PSEEARDDLGLGRPTVDRNTALSTRRRDHPRLERQATGRSARYRNCACPKRMTACRGLRAASPQTRRGTHRGERASTPPDQNVTGRPSALLLDGPPRPQALKVTTRCASRRLVCPCGSGP